jgi:thiol:disulfide interchange protein
VDGKIQNGDGLLSIAASSYGKDVVWLGVFLVFVATAAWVFGEFAQRGRTHKSVAAVVALIILAGGYGFALEKQLHWRQPLKNNSTAELPEKNGFWKTWSPEAVTQARANHSVVLVDFTADWCLTCRVNAQTSLDIRSVSNKLKEINAVALKGDYTHFPENITAELNRYHRAGVPLVLVYPKDPNAPPFVLPEVLTPSIVLDRLAAAAK